MEAARKHLGRDLVAEVREVDARMAKLSTQMSQTIAEHGSRLPEVDGIGPVVAARLLGRTGRFPTASSFASYAGVAPVEVASADRARHRLPRGGDRQLNLALNIVALIQVRMRRSIGRAYYDRKISEGKTHNEAMRCLKRRLADHVWRIMIVDERRKAAAAGGQSGATLTSSAAGPTPATVGAGAAAGIPARTSWRAARSATHECPPRGRRWRRARWRCRCAGWSRR